MSEAPRTITVVIPLKMKHRGGRKAVLTPGRMALHGQQYITLIKAVARAFRWRRMLETGRYGTIDEIAAAEKINDSYVSRVLRLTQPGLLKGVPVEWERQGDVKNAARRPAADGPAPA